jgi:hypothetical protein
MVLVLPELVIVKRTYLELLASTNQLLQRLETPSSSPAS